MSGNGYFTDACVGYLNEEPPNGQKMVELTVRGRTNADKIESAVGKPLHEVCRCIIVTQHICTYYDINRFLQNWQKQSRYSGKRGQFGSCII